MSVGYSSTEPALRPLPLLPTFATDSLALERWHFRLAVAASLIAVLAAPFASALTLEAQLVFLATTVGLFGVPHGALDFLQARVRLRPRFGAAWPVVFAVAYAGVMGVVLASWYWLPSFSLFAFLFVSALHFGVEDTLAFGSRGLARLLETGARGSLPILVPLAFHAETTQFLSWLLPEASALSPIPLQSGAQLMLFFAAAVIAASSMLRANEDELLRVGLLASVFGFLPPLVSFPIYFCVWHAPRHVLGVSRQLAMTTRTMMKSMAFVVAPLTALTLVGGAGAWVYLRASGIDFAPATARVVFIGLSALTIPHMLAAAVFEQKR